MAKKINMKIKALFAMLMCGLSTLSLFPQTDYAKGTYTDAASITRASWNRTGNILRKTIKEVGGSIEKERQANQ